MKWIIAPLFNGCEILLEKLEGNNFNFIVCLRFRLTLAMLIELFCLN